MRQSLTNWLLIFAKAVSTLKIPAFASCCSALCEPDLPLILSLAEEGLIRDLAEEGRERDGVPRMIFLKALPGPPSWLLLWILALLGRWCFEGEGTLLERER